ncbi:MAG TPA: hypothetical protein VM166_04880 [Gemmatimonadaceae bacterium]|nr:hypothetical protein [Gemmatimonadaceae bacterium]
MQSINRGIMAATALLVLLSFTACSKKNDAAQDTSSLGATPDSQPLRVSDIQVGRRIGADKRINDQATDFGVRDTVYASVTTEGAATSSNLVAKWTFNGKQVVDSSTQNVSPRGGTNVTEFHISKATAWPKGAYKVEIFLDGASAGSKDFNVK